MKETKVGPVTVYEPETPEDRERLIAMQKRGAIDEGMEFRMKPEKGHRGRPRKD